MVSYTSLCMFEGFSTVEIEVQPHEQPFLAYQTFSLGLMSEQLVSAGPQSSHRKCFKLHVTLSIIMKIIQGLKDSMKDCTQGVIFSLQTLI